MSSKNNALNCSSGNLILGDASHPNRVGVSNTDGNLELVPNGDGNTDIILANGEFKVTNPGLAGYPILIEGANGDISIGGPGTLYFKRLVSGWIQMEANNTVTPITVANGWAKAAGVTTSGYLNKMDMPANNRLRSLYPLTLNMLIIISATVTQSQLAGSTVTASIHKNGTRIVGTNTTGTFFGVNTGYLDLVTMAIVSLSFNDYVELFVTDSVNVTNVTVANMSMVATPT